MYKDKYLSQKLHTRTGLWRLVRTGLYRFEPVHTGSYRKRPDYEPFKALAPRSENHQSANKNWQILNARGNQFSRVDRGTINAFMTISQENLSPLFKYISSVPIITDHGLCLLL